jgi:pimeloyl-ACP methyl ester carboxylesterase
VIPETRYAKTSDGIHIAYQVLGDGPIDLVYVGPWVTHIEYPWELPQYASYLRRIASFSRLIMFDKRGFGMSDPVPADQLPNLETRMDDLRAVVDEVGSDRAVIYGASESGMLDLLYAATYPERTLALVIHGSYPSARWEPEAPWGWREDEFAERLAAIEWSWGTEEFLIRWALPEIAEDPKLLRWFKSYTRRGASPGDRAVKACADTIRPRPAQHGGPGPCAFWGLSRRSRQAVRHANSAHSATESARWRVLPT